MKVMLKAKFGNSEILFEVGLLPIVVGRGDTANVMIPDENISRNHCRFFVRNGQLWVEDMKSKNGVYVNAIKNEKKQLLLTDRIHIGKVEIRVPSDRNTPEVIRALSSPTVIKNVKQDLLAIETNPAIDELRHNPLKALKEVPEGTTILNRQKLMENKLFKDSFAGAAKAKVDPAREWKERMAGRIDQYVPIVGLVLPIFLLKMSGIKVGSFSTTLFIGLVGGVGCWLWNKKFPERSVGKILLRIAK